MSLPPSQTSSTSTSSFPSQGSESNSSIPRSQDELHNQRQRAKLSAQRDRHKNYNIIDKLRLRSVRGNLQRLPKTTFSKHFYRLPPRLGFPLRSLVDRHILVGPNPHVFLGFTKCGNFAVSYTCSVSTNAEYEEEVYSCTQTYRLYWWKFVPNKKLQLLSSVRLFRDEDICQDIYIVWCEWPTDSSKVLIYGLTHGSNLYEDKHQCYVTVAAKPSLNNCVDCKLAAAMASSSRGGAFDANDHQQQQENGAAYGGVQCLRHGFAVHTKYELASPFPHFAPSVQLEKDGMVLLNTGESIISLDVTLDTSDQRAASPMLQSQEGSSISSPPPELETCNSLNVTLDTEEVNDNMPQIPCMPAAAPSADVLSASVRTDSLNNSTSECPVSQTEAPCSCGSSCCSSNNNSSGPATPHSTPPHSGNYELQPSSSCGSPGFAQRWLQLTTSRSNQQPQQQQQQEEEGEMSGNNSTNKMERQLNDPYDFNKMQETDYMKPPLFKYYYYKDSDSRFSNRHMIGFSYSNKAMLSTALGYNVCGGVSCDATRAATSPASQPSSQESTSSSNIGTANLAGCSWQQHKGAAEQQLKSVIFSQRVYVDAGTQFQAEDEFLSNMESYSVLPVQVTGSNEKPLNLLSSTGSSCEAAAVVVRQLTLDVEQYLLEAIHNYSSWSHRYIAFNDYDVQIVEVCAESNTTVLLIVALVNARPPGGSGNVLPKLYEVCVKLLWNFVTGACLTAFVSELNEFGNPRSTNHPPMSPKKWHPGQAICQAMRQKYAIPRDSYRSVRYMTNDSAFHGHSLRTIVDPMNYIALVL